MSERVQVLVRFRPENEKEAAKGGRVCATVPAYSNEECEIDCSAQGFGKKTFTFDRAFGFDSTQEDVYNIVGEPIVESVLNGYNGTVLAYGQTSSGKTHTMMGPEGGSLDSLTPGTVLYKQRGLIPRITGALFEHLDNINKQEIEWAVKVSNFELYKEQIRDLLNIEVPSSEFKIREDTITGKGIYVENLSEVVVSSISHMFEVLQRGTANRKVAATNANDTSSRSHSIVQLTVEQTNMVQNGTRTIGRLNLVDLAGSEKVAKTGAEGERLKEAQSINLSLTLLGQVIYKLTDGHSVHIPYRDSKLTRILQDSFGGNSRTLLLCACSPSSFNQAETLSTLQFASRAKQIKNKPRVNKEMNLQELNIAYAKALEQIRVLKDQVSDLEEQLATTKGKGIPVGSGIRAATGLHADRRPPSSSSSSSSPAADSNNQQDENLQQIEELKSIIRSLKEELQERRAELIERTAEITTLKSTVDFWSKKHTDADAKIQELQKQLQREKQATQSWMRKAQEANIASIGASSKQASSGGIAKKASTRRMSLAKKPQSKKPSKPKGKASSSSSTPTPTATTTNTNKQEDNNNNQQQEDDDDNDNDNDTESGETGGGGSAADNNSLLEAYQLLKDSEEAAQKRCEAMQSELDATKQRLLHADRQNQDYGIQKAKFAAEMDEQKDICDKLTKELDTQRKCNITKDHEIEELQKELKATREAIMKSQLSAEEKERLLGQQLQGAQDAFAALQGENAHLEGLAKQLGKEANQREICEIVSIDLMVKGEDLSALDNEVYLLELFDSHMEDESTNVNKMNTLATVKELNTYLAHVQRILSTEKFGNPTTESQRISLLYNISEMTSKADELHRRLLSL